MVKVDFFGIRMTVAAKNEEEAAHCIYFCSRCIFAHWAFFCI